MTDFKLDMLSLKQLKSLQIDVGKAIVTQWHRQMPAARAELQEHAGNLGFSLQEIVGVGLAKSQRAQIKAKYRHPENAEIVWSGIGRKPGWFTAAISAGKKPDDLAV